MQTNPVTSQTAGENAAASGGQTAAGPADQLNQRETFLKLLIAQIRNQNPLNPADGIEFVTQLTQFSELEQMIQIRSELESIRKALAPETSGAGEEKGDQ